MKKILPVLYVLLIILFESCVSLRPTFVKDNFKQLTEDNLNILDGNYEIYSTEKSFRTLSFLTTYSDFYNFNRLPQKGDFVNLKAIDKRRLKVTLYHNESIIKTRIIKGKIKQNYFDYKIHGGSFYFFINSYGEQNNRIGIQKNGDLSIDATNVGCILLVLLPFGFGGSEHFNLIFRRIGSS